MTNSTHWEKTQIAANSNPNKITNWNGCRERKSMSLKLWKRHVLTMRYPAATMMSIQVMQLQSEEIGSPPEKCTTAAMTPAPAGMGIPTKYFFPGLPGFEGCGFNAMLNRAKRLAPAIKNRKLEMEPS